MHCGFISVEAWDGKTGKPNWHCQKGKNHDKANTNYLELKEEHDDKANAETMTDHNLELDIVTFFTSKRNSAKHFCNFLVLHQLDNNVFVETVHLRKHYIWGNITLEETLHLRKHYFYGITWGRDIWGITFEAKAWIQCFNVIKWWTSFCLLLTVAAVKLSIYNC